MACSTWAFCPRLLNISPDIDQQAGAHTPYVGALFNSSPTNDQHYGYWDIGMAVDRVPGFAFEMSLENVQLTGHWATARSILASAQTGLANRLCRRISIRMEARRMTL